MKTLNQSFFTFLFTFFTLGLVAQASTFKQVATAANTTANYTVINHARTNNQANKVIFVTHDYGTGPYVTSPVGVWYTGSKWAIFTQDRKVMKKGTKFNVLVQTTADRGVFIHKASRANLRRHITTLNSHSTNGRPNAKIIVTQNWGSSGPYNPHEIGVYYANGKWHIFNQDKSPIPSGAKFNVMVDHSASFTTTATAANTNAHIHKMSNSRTNNKANAFVFVTQNWGTTGPYNTNTVGVWYAGNKWNIYNETKKPMPKNAKFNVVAFSLGSIQRPIKKIDGNWVNENRNTRSIPKLKVYASSTKIHAWGKCHPTNCNWGAVALTKSGSSYRAIFNNQVSKRTLTITPLAGNRLKVSMVTNYKDSRPTQRSIQYFKRPAPSNIDGLWVNSAGGLAKLKISNNSSKIHAWASCGSGFCDWDSVALVKSGTKYKATYNDHVAKRYLTISKIPNGKIQVKATYDYKDSRPTKHFSYIFTKKSSI